MDPRLRFSKCGRRATTVYWPIPALYKMTLQGIMVHQKTSSIQFKMMNTIMNDSASLRENWPSKKGVGGTPQLVLKFLIVDHCIH